MFFFTFLNFKIFTSDFFLSIRKESKIEKKKCASSLNNETFPLI